MFSLVECLSERSQIMNALKRCKADKGVDCGELTAVVLSAVNFTPVCDAPISSDVDVSYRLQTPTTLNSGICLFCDSDNLRIR